MGALQSSRFHALIKYEEEPSATNFGGKPGRYFCMGRLFRDYLKTAITPLESHAQPSLTPLPEYCNLAAVFFQKSG